MKQIHAISLNTAVDMRMVIQEFTLGGVIRSERYSEFAAGKAVNNARAIASLGIGVNLHCFSGLNDVDLFSTISPLVNANVIGVDGFTRRNLTLVNSHSKLICHVQNHGYTLKFENLVKLEGHFFPNVKTGDVVIISGSMPEGTPPGYLNKLVKCIRDRDGIVLLDVDPILLSSVDSSCVRLVKPNLEEICRLSGKKLEQVADIVLAAYDLIASDIVVVSLGDKGAVWIDRKERTFICGNTLTMETGPADVIGCGDAMVGGLALGIAQNAEWQDVFKMGIACGYANMFVEGPGIISLEHYKSALNSINLSGLQTF